MPISPGARQTFRQRMQSIEKADEILDALNEFTQRFELVSGTFSSTNWETLKIKTIQEGETLMVSFSVIGKENIQNQAGIIRTAVFSKNSSVLQSISMEQADFTGKSASGFSARIIADNGNIKFQVKGNSVNLTKWQGSIQTERLGG